MNTFVVTLFALLMIVSDASEGARWLRTDDLPLRQADAAERARIRESLAGTQVRYNFDDESVRVLVHDGDLVVPGDFDNGDLLVVRGNLTVEGVYDDYGEGIGVLVVEGDMRAQNLYSWGAIRVAGKLEVRDLLMTVYNDFTFEAGEVSARLLLVSDKSSDYRVGQVGIALTDEGDETQYALALRQLLPEAFTGPDHFEYEPDPSLWSLAPDQDWLRRRLHEAQPVFRSEPAPEALVGQTLAVLAADAEPEQLQSLAGQDRLLAQLIAARPGLPAKLVESLLALDDERVDQWLGRNAPAHLAGRDPHKLSLEAARALALNDAAPAAMVEALTAHADAQVRVLVAAREDLPDTSLARLQADADAEVRERFWRVHAWQTGFGWDPGKAAVDARLADQADGVRNAMVRADLDVAQLEALLPRLTSEGLGDLAQQLWEIRVGQVPSRLTGASVDAFALRLLDLPRERYEDVHAWVDARTKAWLALDPVAQATRLQEEVEDTLARLGRRERPGLDLLKIAQHARSAVVLQRFAALLGPPPMEELARALAKNRRLPTALQLKLVERAAAVPPGRGEPGDATPEGALDELLQNDDLDDATVEAVLALILKRGIRPADGSYQNSFFHRHNLPQSVIAKLDQRLGYSEDWALTMMLQQHATRAQLTRGLARWYDDDAQLQAELAAAARLDDDGFWLALARANSPKLREAALHPASSAAAVQWLVDHPDPELGWRAPFHPRRPLASRLAKIGALPASQWESDYLDLPASAWQALAGSAASRAQRRVAFARASEENGRIVE